MSKDYLINQLRTKVEAIHFAGKNYLCFDEVVDFIGNLFKTETPTIPQMVADWITEEQKNYKSLTHAFAQVNAMHAFGQYGSKESRDKRDETKKWIIENEMVFAVAWDKGFNVEEEPRYRVKLPDGRNKPDKFFALVKRDSCVTIERVKANKYKYEKAYRLTEDEISLNHEYLWEFAERVEDKGLNNE